MLFMVNCTVLQILFSSGLQNHFSNLLALLPVITKQYVNGLSCISFQLLLDVRAKISNRIQTLTVKV